MKLLLDTCVWGGAKKTLESSGHDVVWTGDWAEDPGDEEILAKAHNEGRILVTLDKDFGEIAIVKGKPHSGILRLVNLKKGTFVQSMHNFWAENIHWSYFDEVVKYYLYIF